MKTGAGERAFVACLAQPLVDRVPLIQCACADGAMSVQVSGSVPYRWFAGMHRLLPCGVVACGRPQTTRQLDINVAGRALARCHIAHGNSMIV